MRDSIRFMPLNRALLATNSVRGSFGDRPKQSVRNVLAGDSDTSPTIPEIFTSPLFKTQSGREKLQTEKGIRRQRMVSCTALKMFAAVLVYLCCYQLVTISALCTDGVTTSGACVQTCKGAGGCTCNTSQPLNTSYDSCSQTCAAPICLGIGKMICDSNKDCNQTCSTGTCDMSCEAVERCVQHGDDNGLKKMSCESKQCTQSCKEGNCKTMHCEGDNCYQSCNKGGCTMNCTQSVKTCVQRCTAIADCIMDCRAEKCHQQCSGPKKCMILNSGFSRISVNYLAYCIVFATVKFFF